MSLAYGATDIRDVVLRLRARLLTVLLIALGAAAVTAVVVALLPKSYRAVTVMTTVPSTEGGAAVLGASTAGGLASSSLGASGFQSTPPILSYLLISRSVMRQATFTPYNGNQTLAEALLRRTIGPDDRDKALDDLRDRIKVTVSRETNFITLSLDARDSAVARETVKRLVAETEKSFVLVMRTQASRLRLSQDDRLDSAKRVLARAEGRLTDFVKSNKQIPPNSRLSIEKEQLVREVQNAELVHQLASNDRESAIARELEKTPALVFVEPLPPQLPVTDKQLVLRAVLVGLGVLVAAMLWLVLRELLRAPAAA